MWLTMKAGAWALTLATLGAGAVSEDIEYGVDISFPMHSRNVSTNYAWLPHNLDPSLPVPDEYKDMPVQPLGNKMEYHTNYLKGCARKNRGVESGCISNDVQRTRMISRQAQSMVNYTKTGYTKIRAPQKVFNLLKEFWEANKHKKTVERWNPTNIYVNHWESTAYMVSVEDKSLEDGGHILKQAVWNAARNTISEWTGQQLAECSLYGIRVYTEGAVLAPHVDRLPLVSSAIINVDQDVDEPWPLEVIGHDGKAVNITMEPGDLVLYESHSVIHGRPFPLKGRFMANIFVHFEPVGKVGEEVVINPELPQYVIPGSPEESNWKKQNRNGYSIAHTGFMTGTTAAHQAAQVGNAELVRKLLVNDPDMLHAKDKNGWQPIHEAARHGHVDAVKALVELGADINARTGSKDTENKGGSPLWWAQQYVDDGHSILNELIALGAKSIAPGDSAEL